LYRVDDLNGRGSVVSEPLVPARFVLVQNNVDRLRSVMQQIPAHSGRRGLILHEGFRLHSYRTHITQELNEQYEPWGVNVFRQFMDLVGNDEGVCDALIMPDEAHSAVT
jgi:hypothetical protein